MAKKHRRTKQAAGRPAPREGSETLWQRLSGAQQHAVCLVLLLLVAVGFFAPTLFSDKTLLGSDIVNWRAMAEVMWEFKEETGREALWAPNAFGGMPGYLISFPNKIPQLDEIPRMLRSFAWPASHFIFLLLGTYLLVFYLTRDKWGGVLAACAYGLTTYIPIILVAGHNSKFVALSFAPWLVLAFVHALRKPGLLAGLLFAMAMAVNLRAGHVQITYYFSFLLGIWWLVEGIRAFRAGTLKTFGRSTGWLAVGAILSLLMVAQPYLSTFEYKDYTIRGAATGGGEGGLDWSYAVSWSQGIGELVTLLVADAYGGSRLYWGPKPFTAGPHYVGGIVLVLALLALWRYRRPAVWALGAGFVLMTLFSLGEHFPLLNRPMFNYFPLFDAFRVPETWLSAVAFSLAVLAGIALDYLGRRESSTDEARQKTRAVYLALGVGLGIVLLLMLGRDVFFDFERPGEYEQIVRQIAIANDVSPSDPRVAQTAEQYIAEARSERADMFADDALRTLIFLLLAGGVVVAFRRSYIPAWALKAGLVVLVALDLGGIGRRYFNEEVLSAATDPEDAIATYDFDRFILERREEAGGPGHFRVLSLEQGDPWSNARPSYHYESIGGYHGAKLRLFQDFVEHVLVDSETGLPNDNALDILNTRYVVAGGRLPGMEVIYQGPETGLFVLENPDVVPRAYFVGEIEVAPSPEETWERLRSEEFDPRRTAILPEPIDFETTPIDSASTTEVVLQQHGPREIVWQVETDAPRLLVVSEIYYPAGWNAYVDGEQVPIYRANYLLRAVPVEAGAHEVVMRFEPASYRIGLWVAGLTTLFVYGAVLVLLGRSWMRRKQSDRVSAVEETS